MGEKQEEQMHASVDEADQEESKKKEKKKRACIGCLSSVMVSMTGGLLIFYWELKYQHTSSQLWMVPLGLILLITPLISCFTLAVSEFCISSGQDQDFN